MTNLRYLNKGRRCVLLYIYYTYAYKYSSYILLKLTCLDGLLEYKALLAVMHFIRQLCLTLRPKKTLSEITILVFPRICHIHILWPCQCVVPPGPWLYARFCYAMLGKACYTTAFKKWPKNNCKYVIMSRHYQDKVKQVEQIRKWVEWRSKM